MSEKIGQYIFYTNWKIPCDQNVYVCQGILGFRGKTDQGIEEAWAVASATIPYHPMALYNASLKKEKREEIKSSLVSLIVPVIEEGCLGMILHAPYRDINGEWVLTPQVAGKRNAALKRRAKRWDKTTAYIPATSIEIYDNSKDNWVKY